MGAWWEWGFADMFLGSPAARHPSSSSRRKIGKCQAHIPFLTGEHLS